MKPTVPAGAGRAARRVAAVLLAALLASAAAACGGGDRSAGEADGDSTGGTSPADSAGTASPAASPRPAAADSGGNGRPLRAFRFRLHNRSPDTAVVRADAGAGAVVLDTVGPADSTAVRVETRADRLELRARAEGRAEVARVLYDLDRPPGDTLLEFEVPPTAPPDTAGG